MEAETLDQACGEKSAACQSTGVDDQDEAVRINRLHILPFYTTSSRHGLLVKDFEMIYSSIESNRINTSHRLSRLDSKHSFAGLGRVVTRHRLEQKIVT
jgi:hypothetical protein